MSTHTRRHRPHRDAWFRTPSLGLVLALAVAACSSGSGDAAEPTTTDPAHPTTDPDAECPTEVDTEHFASAEDLRDLLAEFNDFGLRSPASDQHEAAIDWLADE